MKNRGIAFLALTGTCLASCNMAGIHTSIGPPITDSSDPGFLDLGKGVHEISPWFSYRIEGRQWSGNRRITFLHQLGDGEQEVLGAMHVDGWITSINEREAAYAISEDGRTLLYFHEFLEHGPPGKRTGLHQCVHGEGDRLIQEGAKSVWVSFPSLYSLPRNTILFFPPINPGLFAADGLEIARFRDTEGDDAPLILWGGNALHTAAFNGDEPAAQAALARGEDLEAKVVLGLTPLFLAVKRGHSEMVRTLIEAKADLDQTLVDMGMDLGITPLHVSVSCQNEQVVEALIEGGADVNAIAADGFTPLRVALETLAHESSSPIQGETSNGPGEKLGSAAKKRTIESDGPNLIEMLLVAGANPEIRDSRGNAALHRAVEIGNQEAIDLLLQFGAQPDARGHDDATPLHVAKTKEVAELLLAYGASPDARNEAGELPKILEDPERSPVRSGRGRPDR